MSNNYFKFKQFCINHEHSAMKVGTDGVLLGAWANTDQCKKILDVGTGTGLIALMMAQRSDAAIVGIEIDETAALEAKTNVKQAPFGAKVNIINQDFKQFYADTTDKFDLIISNPPYFENSLNSPYKQRNQARHNNTLNLEDLIEGSLTIMEEHGRLALVYPYKDWELLKNKAEERGLWLHRLTKVHSFEDKDLVRVLVEFSRDKRSMSQEERLVLYKNEKRERTDAYWALTNDFYLDK